MTLREDCAPPEGPLECHCGGALDVVEIYFANPWDVEHRLTYITLDDGDPTLGVCTALEYGGDPVDESERPSFMVWLSCRQCGKDHHLVAQIEPDGKTKFFWDTPPRRDDDGGKVLRLVQPSAASDPPDPPTAA